jgi:hypothetical protein
MRRRLLMAALGCWPATRLLAQEPVGQAHQKISANELRRKLMARFPVDFALPGVLQVRIDARGLLLLPARQRLGARLLARFTEFSTGHVYPCEADLTFAVRYEAADQTLRAHDLEIAGLRSPALPPDTARAWQALLDQVVRGAVDEIILHRFTREELAMPDLLGLQPDQITVERDGLEIWFGNKPKP